MRRDKGPAPREMIARHPDDPCKGIAFVYRAANGRLTLAETDQLVATLDLESWFGHLLAHGANEIAPGVAARVVTELS